MNAGDRLRAENPDHQFIVPVFDIFFSDSEIQSPGIGNRSPERNSGNLPAVQENLISRIDPPDIDTGFPAVEPDFLTKQKNAAIPGNRAGPDVFPLVYRLQLEIMPTALKFFLPGGIRRNKLFQSVFIGIIQSDDGADMFFHRR